MAALGYHGAKISLKEDFVPTLFPVAEAMWMPPIRRSQAATRASMTTVHLGSKRAVSADTGDVGPQLIRPGEFRQLSFETSALNSGDFGFIAQRA